MAFLIKFSSLLEGINLWLLGTIESIAYWEFLASSSPYFLWEWQTCTPGRSCLLDKSDVFLPASQSILVNVRSLVFIYLLLNTALCWSSFGNLMILIDGLHLLLYFIFSSFLNTSFHLIKNCYLFLHRKGKWIMYSNYHVYETVLQQYLILLLTDALSVSNFIVMCAIPVY